MSVPCAAGSAPAVECLNPLDSETWDDRVAELPGATFFHGQAWARVLTETYGFSPQYLTTREGGHFTGLAPLMEIRSWLTGRRGVSLPFTDRCDVLARSPALARRLREALVELGCSRRWSYLELRGNEGFDAGTPYVSYVEHTLALAQPSTTLLEGTDPAVRRAIRKAEKSGLSVELGHSHQALRLFYSLFCETRRRHGAPPQPWRFFESIQRHVIDAGHGMVVLARHGTTPVAGAVFFRFGSKAIYKFGASSAVHQQLRGNNLVMWRAIEHFADSHCTTLDFGRTSLTNEGLRQFKSSWGTRETPLSYHRFDCQRMEYVTGSDRAAGWQANALKLLPQWALRSIGAAAYRHIA